MKFRELAKKVLVKYGTAIATCAFAFVAVSANTGCIYPFYEPEEPEGLDSFKKFKR